MTVTEDYLAHNAEYAKSFRGPLPLPPSKHVAIVACMGARPDVYHALGIKEGEAHVIRDAGGVITDDAIRSLAISQGLWGTREIILIHHTDCGMLTFHDDDFKHAIQEETGVKPPWAAESFPDVAEDVRQSLRRVENSPFVTKHQSLRGFIFDVATGKLGEVKLWRSGSPSSYPGASAPGGDGSASSVRALMSFRPTSLTAAGHAGFIRGNACKIA